MKIAPLQYGVYNVSKDKVFTPKDTQQDTPLPQGEAGYLTMAVCPFLIEVPAGLFLLDAGLDTTVNGTPQILHLIEQAGYKPADITAVLLSHLHKDHTDGLGYFEGDTFVPNFPEAKIYYQQREMDYALAQTESHSFDLNVLKQVAQLPNLVAMNDDNGNINEYISYEVTGGHSPYHQVFWVKDGNETAFFGADNLPQRAYLKFHIAYKTDYDGKKARDYRITWEQQAKENNWQVLLYHDTKPVVTL